MLPLNTGVSRQKLTGEKFNFIFNAKPLPILQYFCHHKNRHEWPQERNLHLNWLLREALATDALVQTELRLFDPCSILRTAGGLAATPPYSNEQPLCD